MAGKLCRVRAEFIHEVSSAVILQLLDDLLKDKVLAFEERASILEKNKTNSEQALSLFETVMRKGDEASERLIAHLQSRDPILCTELGLSGFNSDKLLQVRAKFVYKVSHETIMRFLDDLVKEGVLFKRERDSILEKNKTSVDRALSLIDIVIRNGDGFSGRLIAVLQSTDPMLYTELGLSGSPSDKLLQVRAKFVHQVSHVVILQLLDDLLADKVLTDAETASILRNKTVAECARSVFETVMRKGHEASERLIAHLQSRDPSLCTELGLSRDQLTHLDKLLRVRAKFVYKVSSKVIFQLLEDLSEDEVLSDRKRYSILQKDKTVAEWARSLFDTVMREGDEASEKLIAHLQSRDPSLCTELGLSRDQLTHSGPSRMLKPIDAMDPRNWTELEPVVHTVEEVQTYSHQSDAGCFKCSVSALRWVCKEKVSFKYQFCSWEEHSGPSCMDYMPAGPLLDITVTAGKMEEVHLPHWICVEHKSMSNMFTVLHVDTCGDVVEQVSEVTKSHVKLLQPTFSASGSMIRKILGFPVKVSYEVLIYKTSKADLTLHVYLVPQDPFLKQTVKTGERADGSRRIRKPNPTEPLRTENGYILSTCPDGAEICPEKMNLTSAKRSPNFFEVYVRNARSNFDLKLDGEQERSEGKGSVWTCTIRTDD